MKKDNKTRSFSCFILARKYDNVKNHIMLGVLKELWYEIIFKNILEFKYFTRAISANNCLEYNPDTSILSQIMDDVPCKREEVLHVSAY